MIAHKCTECKHEYGSFSCGRNIVTNPHTNLDSGCEDRSPNEKGNCGFYVGTIDEQKSIIKREDLQDDEDRFAEQENEND